MGEGEKKAPNFWAWSAVLAAVCYVAKCNSYEKASRAVLDYRLEQMFGLSRRTCLRLRRQRSLPGAERPGARGDSTISDCGRPTPRHSGRT